VGNWVIGDVSFVGCFQFICSLFFFCDTVSLIWELSMRLMILMVLNTYFMTCRHRFQRLQSETSSSLQISSQGKIHLAN
jgi:hypothetical protein